MKEFFRQQPEGLLTGGDGGEEWHFSGPSIGDGAQIYPVMSSQGEPGVAKLLDVLPGNRTREIDLHRRLAQKPHVVGLLDSRVGTTSEDASYLIMPNAEYGDLAHLIPPEGMPPELALDLISQSLEGLREIHDAGVAHNDFKPHNLLLAERGVELADFGIADKLDDDDPGQMRGTAAYVSPELLQGLVGTPKSDIYIAGGTIYHMLSGQPPFQGKDATEIVVAKLEGAPALPPLPDILGDRSTAQHHAFTDVISRATAHDPDDRQADVEELAEEIEKTGEAKEITYVDLNSPTKRIKEIAEELKAMIGEPKEDPGTLHVSFLEE